MPEVRQAHLLSLQVLSVPRGVIVRGQTAAVNNSQNDVSLLSVERSSSMRCGSPPLIWTSQ